VREARKAEPPPFDQTIRSRHLMREQVSVPLLVRRLRAARRLFLPISIHAAAFRHAS